MTLGDSSSWKDEGSSVRASQLCQSLQQHHILVKNEKPSANASVEKRFKTALQKRSSFTGNEAPLTPSAHHLLLQEKRTFIKQTKFGPSLEKEQLN